MDYRIDQLFSGLQDPRIDRCKKHPLNSVLFIVLCGSLAGIDCWTGYEDYAEANQDVLSQFIDLPEGIPSHDTIARVIAALDVDAFAQCFHRFTDALRDCVKDVIAVDGKTIRRSGDRKNKARHIVSAWSSQCQLALAQIKTDDKSNEITAIPDLLDLLDLQGHVVTIDAMGCQRAICHTILDKGGDYVIALKGNQGNLFDDVKAYFDNKEHPITQQWSECDKGHGRIEERTCYALDHIEWLLKEHHWPGLKSIAKVQSTRQTKTGTTQEERYYISSLEADAERLAKAARSHWGIENRLHWVLDVTFNEDGAHIRKENAPEILSMMRKWSLNIINQNKGNLSVKRMMHRISISSKNLLSILQTI